MLPVVPYCYLGHSNVQFNKILTLAKGYKFKTSVKFPNSTHN